MREGEKERDGRLQQRQALPSTPSLLLPRTTGDAGALLWPSSMPAATAGGAKGALSDAETKPANAQRAWL